MKLKLKFKEQEIEDEKNKAKELEDHNDDLTKKAKKADIARNMVMKSLEKSMQERVDQEKKNQEHAMEKLKRKVNDQEKDFHDKLKIVKNSGNDNENDLRAKLASAEEHGPKVKSLESDIELMAKHNKLILDSKDE